MAEEGSLLLNSVKSVLVSVLKLGAVIIAWILKVIGQLILYTSNIIFKTVGR